MEKVTHLRLKTTDESQLSRVNLNHFAYEYVSLQLDIEEAAAIFIGGFRDASDTLNDDYVALALPYLTELEAQYSTPSTYLQKWSRKKC